jgi:predicted acyltransferase
VSTALLMDRMSRKGVAPDEIAHRVIRRGAEIFALGLLFRLQEYILAWGYSPWTDLLRVDILNTIGLSIMFLGVVGRLAESTRAKAMLAAVVALGIAIATPPLWTTRAPGWLPWYLESYINGVHNFGQPQPWLFPIFPWTAFAFAGMAAGLWLWHNRAMEDEARPIALLAAAGVGIFLVSWWLETRPRYLYAVHDYWHTSPNFFLARVGIILVIVLGAYIWCRWGAGQIGFSPLIQLGQTSLLVYWVHIEFVYGGLSILAKRGQTIPMATFGLLLISVAMVLLSMARTRWKGHGAEILVRLRSGQHDEGQPQSATAD